MGFTRSVTLLLLVAALTPAAASARAVDVRGVLTEVAGDPGAYTISTGEGDLLVRTNEPMPPSGSEVRARGTVRGSRLTLSEPPAITKAAASSITLGPRKTLVLLIDLGDPVPEVPAFVKRVAFVGPDSMASFFNEASYGQTTLVGIKDEQFGDVAGPFTAPADGSTCAYWEWGTAARAQAQAAGFDVGAYDHVVHYWSQRSECAWGGLAQINGGYSWINGVLGSRVFSHELGHNLGLMHANGYRCRGAADEPVTLSRDCTTQEYLDPFDTMGSTSAHFNAFNKAKLGWIPSGRVQTVTASGSYTLAPSGTASALTQLLEIPSARKGRQPDPLYVEYRRPGLYFERFTPADRVVNGATIRIATGLTLLTRTHLLDMVPSTVDYTDAPLAAGETFTDETRGVTIRTEQAGADTLTVSVTLTT